MTTLRKLYIELEFDWNTLHYRNNTSDTLLEIFAYPIIDLTGECKAITDNTYGIDRNFFLIETMVPEEIFSDYLKDYDAFIEKYFDHITLSDFAVKRFIVKEKVKRGFLAQIFSLLPKSMVE